VIINKYGKLYNKDALRSLLYDEARKAYKEGKITKDEYKGYTGENPIERTSKNDRSVNGKKPQQKSLISIGIKEDENVTQKTNWKRQDRL